DGQAGPVPRRPGPPGGGVHRWAPLARASRRRAAVAALGDRARGRPPRPPPPFIHIPTPTLSVRGLGVRMLDADLPVPDPRRATFRRLAPLALMPAAAFAVHQLRYWLAFHAAAGTELQRQGHAYMHSLVPWLVLLIALAVGGFLRALGRALGG